MNTLKIPVYGYWGLVLLLGGWFLNWFLPGLRSHIFFFPMWLGYCLAMDALVFWRKGTSLINRSIKKYIWLFFISSPVWWLFEWINLRTQNWYYTGREHFSDLEYAVFASFSFSTVIPAVFASAEFIGTLKWVKSMKKGPPIKNYRTVSFLFFIMGWLSLVLLYVWPRYFFPFVWMSVFFIVEPINIWLGNSSLLYSVKNGNWQLVATLSFGCLLTGFFWEFWNYFSFPKWIYVVPFVDFLHIFEMPILGYLGYIPFSFELYAVYSLVSGIMQWNKDDKFIRIVFDV